MVFIFSSHQKNFKAKVSRQSHFFDKTSVFTIKLKKIVLQLQWVDLKHECKHNRKGREEGVT